jgi:hypothetical protein
MIDLLDNLLHDLLLAEVEGLTDEPQVGYPPLDEDWPVIVVQGRDRVGAKKVRERGLTLGFQAVLDNPAPPGYRKYVDLEPTMTRSQGSRSGRATRCPALKKAA